MGNTGSLIPIHAHENKDILDLLTEGPDGTLYYNGTAVCLDYTDLAIRIIINDMWTDLQTLYGDLWTSSPIATAEENT